MQMTDEIHIQEMAGPTAGESDVEMVERKGLGHPDTICDLVRDLPLIRHCPKGLKCENEG
jgi:S-adenosylmethionine synthetase